MFVFKANNSLKPNGVMNSSPLTIWL